MLVAYLIYENFSGSCVRPTYRMLEAGDMKAYGWLDSDGSLDGYVRAVPTDDQKTLHSAWKPQETPSRVWLFWRSCSSMESTNH